MRADLRISGGEPEANVLLLDRWCIILCWFAPKFVAEVTSLKVHQSFSYIRLSSPRFASFRDGTDLRMRGSKVGRDSSSYLPGQYLGPRLPLRYIYVGHLSTLII